jgi:hypothetical protein
MTTSIQVRSFTRINSDRSCSIEQAMQQNDLLRSSASTFGRSPHLLTNDLPSQLSMLYAITQQSMASASPSTDLSMESKLKRIK